MSAIAITGSGVSVPDFTITNEELCVAFNQYVRLFNEENAAAIEAGDVTELRESTADFIENASGMKQRYVVNKSGIMDPKIMRPVIHQRPNTELCHQAELSVKACEQALAQAGRVGEDVDMVLLATSNMQRAYPAVAMEVQHALGARGFAYDMNVACSSGTFAIQAAADAVRAGSARCAIVVVPEIMSGHLNWRDRDSHFIFGDGCAAFIIERLEESNSENLWEIRGTRALTQYSHNIRNNGSYLGRCEPERRDEADKLFTQQGRKVFKDIVPLAANFIKDHMTSLDLSPETVSRYWLHQANANMNRLIARRVVGRDTTPQEAPTILDRYANTAGAGSMIAFHLHNEDMEKGASGVLCSFGAGYSIGSVILRRV
ncbi:MAG: beta-ketoacyl-ACP synthase III [Myxococcales bacterium]|nr:beta-ketoacyl-ACP synthase III [Myxococcales bacterium]